MTKIGLTKFLDFTSASGTARLTQVRQAMMQDRTRYSPATDFWRPMRDGIRDEFETGWRGADSLRRLRQTTRDSKKHDRYAECVRGLSKWARGKSFGLSKRKSGLWTSGDLTVVVNPELVLEIDGQLTAVKLYFREAGLRKRRVDTLLHLLATGLPGKARPAILDVPRGRLIVETVSVPGLDILLEGDAAQFSTMWHLLERQSQTP
jgi:hypothetical protein